MLRVAATIIAAVALFGLASTSAFADDEDTCNNLSMRDRQSIGACTRLIEAGGFRGRDLAGLYYARGNKHRFNRNFDPAIEDFSQAIDVDPDWSWPYVARGHTYADKGDFKRAFADQESAIRIEPTAVTYTGRAIDLIKAGSLDHAISDLDKALQINPRYFYAYLNRGDVYLKKGDHQRALADYRKALEIKPGDRAAEDGMRQAQERLGR